MRGAVRRGVRAEAATRRSLGHAGLCVQTGRGWARGSGGARVGRRGPRQAWRFDSWLKLAGSLGGQWEP